MGKKSGSGSGISWVKIPKFFEADPLSAIRDGKNLDRDSGWKKFGSGINIPDPQHCPEETFLSRGACLEDREKPKLVVECKKKHGISNDFDCFLKTRFG
jgi:hypothetical protein